MAQSKPNIIASLFGMKCPNCRKGRMFSNSSIFPLKRMLEMPERCSHCGQKMELEVGFYYGTGYVSYGLSIMLLAIYSAFYWLVFGFSWKDSSPFWLLGTGIVFLIIMQPWIMRMSRVLYLNMFISYGKNKKIEMPNNN